MARNTGRKSKTQPGAKRRGVIMSVLASLSKRMEHFTLGSVLAEINRWIETGQFFAALQFSLTLQKFEQEKTEVAERFLLCFLGLLCYLAIFASL